MKKKSTVESRSTQSDEKEQSDLSFDNQSLANLTVPTPAYNQEYLNRRCDELQTREIRRRLHPLASDLANLQDDLFERNPEENNAEVAESYAHGSNDEETIKTCRFHFTEEESSRLSKCMDKLSLSEYGFGRKQSRAINKDNKQMKRLEPKSKSNKNIDIPEGYAYGCRYKDPYRLPNEAPRCELSDESSSVSEYMNRLSLSEYGFGKDQVKKLQRDTGNDYTPMKTNSPDSDSDESDAPEGYAYGYAKEINELSAKKKMLKILREASREFFPKNTNLLTRLCRATYQNEELPEDSNTDNILGDQTKSMKSSVENNEITYEDNIRKGHDESNKLSDKINREETRNLPKTSLSVGKSDDQTIPHRDIEHTSVDPATLREIIPSETAPGKPQESPKKSINQYEHLQYSSNSYINNLIISIIKEKLEFRTDNSGAQESCSDNSAKESLDNNCKYSKAFFNHIFEALKTTSVPRKAGREPTKEEKEKMDRQLEILRQYKIAEASKFKECSAPEPNDDAVSSVINDFLLERLIFLEILLEPLTWLEDQYYEVCFFRIHFSSHGPKQKCRSLSKIFDDLYLKIRLTKLFIVIIIERFKKYGFVMKADILDSIKVFSSLLHLIQGLVARAKKVKDFKDLELGPGDYNFLFMVKNFPNYIELAVEIIKKEISMYRSFVHKQGWGDE